MVIYVFANGSDRTELIETLVKEGVTYQESKATTEREAGVSAVGMVEDPGQPAGGVPRAP